MNIATVSMDVAWKDTDTNIAATETHVKKVLELYPNTDVILFPELSLSGFIVDAGNQETAQPIDGELVQKVKALAKENNVALICGMVESNPDGKPYNTQFVISRTGEFVTSYRKNHLFTASAEPEFYCAGEKLVTFELEGWKCGLSTCFDIRFPRLFESYKQAGVECLFAGFNWVEGRNKPEIMKHLVASRAHENQYFFAAVDRVGENVGVSFYGTSIIANPYAEDVAVHNDPYAYAEIDKQDIADLGSKMPLSGSFKQTYNLG
jgi:predicted amidohydrolase